MQAEVDACDSEPPALSPLQTAGAERAVGAVHPPRLAEAEEEEEAVSPGDGGGAAAEAEAVLSEASQPRGSAPLQAPSCAVRTPTRAAAVGRTPSPAFSPARISARPRAIDPTPDMLQTPRPASEDAPYVSPPRRHVTPPPSVVSGAGPRSGGKGTPRARRAVSRSPSSARKPPAGRKEAGRRKEAAPPWLHCLPPAAQRERDETRRLLASAKEELEISKASLEESHATCAELVERLREGHGRIDVLETERAEWARTVAQWQAHLQTVDSESRREREELLMRIAAAQAKEREAADVAAIAEARTLRGEQSLADAMAQVREAAVREAVLMGGIEDAQRQMIERTHEAAGLREQFGLLSATAASLRANLTSAERELLAREQTMQKLQYGAERAERVAAAAEQQLGRQAEAHASELAQLGDAHRREQTATREAMRRECEEVRVQARLHQEREEGIVAALRADAAAARVRHAEELSAMRAERDGAIERLREQYGADREAASRLTSSLRAELRDCEGQLQEQRMKADQMQCEFEDKLSAAAREHQRLAGELEAARHAFRAAETEASLHMREVSELDARLDRATEAGRAADARVDTAQARLQAEESRLQQLTMQMEGSASRTSQLQERLLAADALQLKLREAADGAQLQAEQFKQLAAVQETAAARAQEELQRTREELLRRAGECDVQRVRTGRLEQELRLVRARLAEVALGSTRRRSATAAAPPPPPPPPPPFRSSGTGQRRKADRGSPAQQRQQPQTSPIRAEPLSPPRSAEAGSV